MSAPLIERFLFGLLDTDEEMRFFSLCEKEASVQRQLGYESAFEALFYDRSWHLRSAAAGIEQEQDFASLIAPLPDIGKENAPVFFSNSEWISLIDSAIKKSSIPMESKGKTGVMFRFPRFARYLAAACLVAAAGILTPLHVPKLKPVVSKTIIVSTIRDQGVPMSQGSSIKTAPKHSLFVFDTVMIYGSRHTVPASIATDRSEGLIQLGSKTGVLLEKNAALAVTMQTDSAVVLCLNRGGALFTVEKNRFCRFTVQTPLCSVAVTGTVFRILVDFDTTKVSVLEGSVRVKKNNDTSIVSIKAGMSAFFRPTECTVSPGDTAATLLFRSSLLHDFIMENGVWENGRFIRSGIVLNRSDKQP